MRVALRWGPHGMLRRFRHNIPQCRIIHNDAAKIRKHQMRHAALRGRRSNQTH